MILKDISFSTPHENIAYDDTLLKLAEEGQEGEVLRFWESPEMFVVLGRISKEEEDVDKEAVTRDNIPILRRSSGGGTVLQGPGCLNYTLILSKKCRPEVADLKKSYQYILNKIIAALETLGVEAFFHPISDITVNRPRGSVSTVQTKTDPRGLFTVPLKISGNAQKRGRNYILHHGTILYDFNLKNIEKYLKIPKSIPEYREKRPHLDFVTNIALSVTSLKQEVQKQFDQSDEKN